MCVFIALEYTMRIVIGKFLKPLSDLHMTGTAPCAIKKLYIITSEYYYSNLVTVKKTCKITN